MNQRTTKIDKGQWLVDRFKLAKLLDCSECHIRRLKKREAIPYVWVGGIIRYDPEAVVAALIEQQQRQD